jgi:hypothetical protein
MFTFAKKSLTMSYEVCNKSFQEVKAGETRSSDERHRRTRRKISKNGTKEGSKGHVRVEDPIRRVSGAQC